MTFTVTYRGADGAMREDRVEAAGRGECFARCRARGIAPLSVREGDFASRRGAEARRGGTGGKGLFSRRGRKDDVEKNGRVERLEGKDRFVAFSLSVALVALIGGGVWWWLGRGEAPSPGPEAPKKTGALAKEVQPATNAAVSAAKEIPAMAEPPARGGETDGAPASLAATNAPKASSKKFRIVRHPGTRKKILFREKSDQRIARLLSVEPGGFLVGTFTYKGFKEQFLRSLSTPIVVTEEDSPKDAALKRAVLETRADLKARLDAGEDIEQIMEETENELRRLSNYRMELVRQINRDKREGKFSSADMKDYVEAANVLLKEKGIKPLAHPEMFYRNVKVHETASGSGDRKD